MKYSEASKQITELSKNYSIIFDPTSTPISNGTYTVYYKDKEIVQVGQEMYRLWYTYKYLYKLPFGNKLWMIMAELAMTPPEDREEEAKYNVIIGKDKVNNIAWRKTDDWCNQISWYKNGKNSTTYVPYCIEIINDFGAKLDDATFTDTEFDDLIKYIKTLPDGEYQAKVAEHGKTLVKDN